ncbi:MAG TPA: hypothetical protein VFA69_09805 [Candidatus Nitrosotalea sp.]|nr:hypothetical protein [Candidatus Nitrosotalea sp.]
MTRSAIGIDSVTFYHDGKTAAFKAPLGVAIEVENYEAFDTRYLQVITGLKSKYSLNTERTCLKGHYILDKLKGKGCDFINDFVDQILPSLKMIFVCHTVVSSEKVPEIFCCNGTKKITTSEFVDRLCSSYEHIIAWKLLQDFADKHNSLIFSDYFTGVVTKAWIDLESNHNLSIVSAGEYCNSLISTADLICKYINDSLRSKNEKLGFYGISHAFQSKAVVEISDKMDGDQISEALKNNKPKLYQRFPYSLSQITPDSFRKIEVDAKMKHPVTYVLTSKKIPHEREAMEHTQLYDILANMSYQSKGCLRSINIDEINDEIRYMQKGDVLVTVGDLAEEKASYIVNDLGVPLRIVSSRDLIKI